MPATAPCAVSWGTMTLPWLFFIAREMGVKDESARFWNANTSAYTSIPHSLFKRFVCDANEVKYIGEIGANPTNNPYVLSNYIYNLCLGANYRKNDADPYSMYPGKKISQLKHASKTGMLWDALPTNVTPYRDRLNTIMVTNTTYNCVGQPHNGKKVTNLLYADGHAVSAIPAPFLPMVFNGTASSPSACYLWESSAPDFSYCN